jgi:hypothetical protein
MPDRNLRACLLEEHNRFMRFTNVLLWCLVTSLPSAGQDNSGTQPQPGPAKYDPSYERIAHGTGGQVIYMDRTDAAKASVIIDAKHNRETIASMYGLSVPGTPEIPVDSFTSSLYVTFSGSDIGSDLKLLRPAGGELEDGRGGRITRMQRTVVIAVDYPEPGVWRAEFIPRGTASIAATAKTDLFVSTFEFDTLQGRPGHQGYMKISGPPTADQYMHAEFTCSENTVRSAEVVLIGNQQQELLQKQFHFIVPELTDEFSGRLRVPDQPVRVVVRGQDINGAPYQRVYSSLFTPARP